MRRCDEQGKVRQFSRDDGVDRLPHQQAAVRIAAGHRQRQDLLNEGRVVAPSGQGRPGNGRTDRTIDRYLGGRGGKENHVPVAKPLFDECGFTTIKRERHARRRFIVGLELNVTVRRQGKQPAPFVAAKRRGNRMLILKRIEVILAIGGNVSQAGGQHSLPRGIAAKLQVVVFRLHLVPQKEDEPAAADNVLRQYRLLVAAEAADVAEKHAVILLQIRFQQSALRNDLPFHASRIRKRIEPVGDQPRFAPAALRRTAPELPSGPEC